MFAANSTSMPTGSLHDMGGEFQALKLTKFHQPSATAIPF